MFKAAWSGDVKAGERLVTLIPDTNDRAVELWVDGNDMPLLSEGRAVRLQFEGWPAVQFTGWPSVAVGTFGGRVALIDQVEQLLTASETGEGFPRRYYEALQRQPAVVLAHADVRRTIKGMR